MTNKSMFYPGVSSSDPDYQKLRREKIKAYHIGMLASQGIPYVCSECGREGGEWFGLDFWPRKASRLCDLLRLADPDAVWSVIRPDDRLVCFECFCELSN